MRKKRTKPRTDCILQFLFSEPDDLRNRLRQDKRRKTSAGIKNKSIRDALVDLLGKPIAESSAVFVPTAM